MTFCTACGLPILAEHHDDHHPGCPNHTNPGTVDCTCDNPVHPWCCHTCKERPAMSGSPFSRDPGPSDPIGGFNAFIAVIGIAALVLTVIYAAVNL